MATCRGCHSVKIVGSFDAYTRDLFVGKQPTAAAPFGVAVAPLDLFAFALPRAFTVLPVLLRRGELGVPEAGRGLGPVEGLAVRPAVQVRQSLGPRLVDEVRAGDGRQVADLGLGFRARAEKGQQQVVLREVVVGHGEGVGQHAELVAAALRADAAGEAPAGAAAAHDLVVGVVHPAGISGVDLEVRQVQARDRSRAEWFVVFGPRRNIAGGRLWWEEWRFPDRSGAASGAVSGVGLGSCCCCCGGRRVGGGGDGAGAGGFPGRCGCL